ncbi:MAG: hypothetical protein MUE81_09685 [Thermoflexibacter sp.]|jgi:hypothetical protein|nr:hypothetical protein [Thermoflexibacter sp.]
MATLIVLFNLKTDISASDYENWAQTTDVPTVKGLKSIQDFKVYRSLSILGSDAKPPYQYFEIIEVADMEIFGQEVGSPTVQKVAGEFQKFADNPIFIFTEQCA